MVRSVAADARQRPDLATFKQLDLEMQTRSYVAPFIMAPLNVGVSAGKYRRVQLKSLLANANADVKRTSRGGYNEGDYEFDTVSFATEEYGWKASLDDREDAIYDDAELTEELATMRCWDVLLNRLEGRVLEKAITATVTASQTTAAGTAWTNHAASNPIDNVFAACEAVYARTGVWPNTLAVSRKRFRDLKRCAVVIAALQANGAGEQALQGSISTQKLAEVFDLQNVVVSDAIKNTANIGQDASIASVFPDTQAWVGVTANTLDLRAPCFGRILHWGGDGSRIDGERMIGVVEEYRDEETRSNKIRVRHETDEHVVYSEMAEVITGVAS